LKCCQRIWGADDGSQSRPARAYEADIDHRTLHHRRRRGLECQFGDDAVLDGIKLLPKANTGNVARAVMEVLMSKWIGMIIACLAANVADPAMDPSASLGTYRLPYADGTTITVFDDFTTHRPRGRIDFFAINGQKPYRIVAAATGRIMAIQDAYSAQQSGRAAAECHNNYVWIAHGNGEWTNYSHLAQGSVTGRAKLKVGDVVEAGAYIGDEAAVGCAMLDHLHFEVAVPDAANPIDRGGFLLDNEAGQRARNPRFCNSDGMVIKGKTYQAGPCG